jgi:hypothetical protein
MRAGAQLLRSPGPTETARQHPHRPAQRPPCTRWRAGLREAEEQVQPPHPRAAAAPGRTAPAQGRPARRADAGRLRVARRGPGLRPAQRTADRQEGRLRRLDASPEGRRPPREAARRPAHRRHPAAQRERHPRGPRELLGHSQMRTPMDIYSHVMPALAREAADHMGTLLLTREAGPTTTRIATTDDSGRPPCGGRPGHRGGAEGTRTPDPHTASSVGGGSRTSAKMRSRRSSRYAAVGRPLRTTLNIAAWPPSWHHPDAASGTRTSQPTERTSSRFSFRGRRGGPAS